MTTLKLLGICTVFGFLVGCNEETSPDVQPVDKPLSESTRSTESAAETVTVVSTQKTEAAPTDPKEVEQTASEDEAAAFQIPTTGNADGIPLRVLYLARSDQERARAFLSLFEEHFQAAASVRREELVPEQADKFDVVVLDWSQDERSGKGYASPLGKLEDWDTPTVLLGSAGMINAGPWNVVGGAG